jgi:hypothetical protein
MKARTALIGCECSAIVRDAFRAHGVDAWSCDIKPCEGDAKWHIQGDVVDAIRSRAWDFIGLHPDCTALSLSGNRWYGSETPMHHKRLDAIEWTTQLWLLATKDCKHVYLENPTSVIWKHLNASVQYIHPWQFGHGEVKKTGLALHGLPELLSAKVVEGREPRVWKMPPGPNRKADRSRTYLGVAQAMAQQWSPLI